MAFLGASWAEEWFCIQRLGCSNREVNACYQCFLGGLGGCGGNGGDNGGDSNEAKGDDEGKTRLTASAFLGNSLKNHT